MLKSTKIILITAGVLVGLGLIIAGIAMAIGRVSGFASGSGTVSSDSVEARKDIITEEFENLKVAEVSSNVNILPSDGSEAYVEYHNGEDYEHKVEVSGKTLKIEYKDNKTWAEKWSAVSWFVKHNEDSARYPVNIYLPATEYEDLDIGLVSGEVSVEDTICSDLKIASVSGSIKVSSCTVSDRTDINAVSGSISISGLPSGDVKINTTSGEVDLTDVNVKDVEIDTISGEITLKSFSSESTDIDTTSGDIRLDGYKSGDTNINTTSGDVTGTVNGTYRLDYDTVSGDVETFGDDPSGAPMEIDTTSGDIRIKSN